MKNIMYRIARRIFSSLISEGIVERGRFVTFASDCHTTVYLGIHFFYNSCEAIVLDLAFGEHDYIAVRKFENIEVDGQTW